MDEDTDMANPILCFIKQSPFYGHIKIGWPYESVSFTLQLFQKAASILYNPDHTGGISTKVR
jgi:hypothetical protein